MRPRNLTRRCVRLHLQTLAILALAPVFFLLRAANADAETAPPDLEQLQRLAEANSDDLRQAHEAWNVARQEISLATALPQPTIEYSHFLEEVHTRVGTQEHRLGVMQMIPWPGKLAARKQQAEHQAAARREDVDNQRLLLRYRVARAYHEYAYLGSAIELLTANLELVENLEQTLRTSYSSSSTPAARLLGLQVEAGKLLDQLESLKIQAPILAARLNAVIGRDPETPIPMVPLPERPQQTRGDFQGLKAALVAAHPDILAQQHQVRSANAGISLARAQARPDIGVGAAYIVTDAYEDMEPEDNGADAVMLTIQLSLPLWTRTNRALMNRALARRRQAEAQARQQTRTLLADLVAAFQAQEDAARRLQLYESSLIPQARQALETVMTAFVSGPASFAELTEARRTLLDLQMLQKRAAADELNAAARIQALAPGLPRGDAPLAHNPPTENPQ